MTWYVSIRTTARWHDVPQYNFKQLLERMRFRHTLTPHPESIYSMVQVRAECNRVSFNMCLFFVPTPKAMRLDDFEQSQSQATSHVSPCTYIYWTASRFGHRAQELCESRDGRPGLSVLMSLTIS